MASIFAALTPALTGTKIEAASRSGRCGAVCRRRRRRRRNRSRTR